MKDCSKKCWNCGSKEVFPIKDYFECSKCGATWVPISEGGFLPNTPVRDDGLSLSGHRAIKTGAPSGSASRQAQKRRESATPE